MPLAFTDMTSVEIFFRLFSERNDPAFNTGVVAGAIKSTKGGYRACDQGFHRRSFGYVSSDENGVSLLLADESDRVVAFIAVHIGDNNLGAFGGKFKRNSAADPCPGTRHKSYLSRYKISHLALSAKKKYAFLNTRFTRAGRPNRLAA